ncbi:MAG: ATP-binding protein [Bacteroidales bacterium]
MRFSPFALISKKQILSYLFVLGALFLLLFSVYYFSEKRILQKSIERDLKVVAELTEAQLSDWYADQMGDVQMVAQNSLLSNLIHEMRKGGPNSPDTALYQFLRQVGSEHDFHIVSLFSTDGNLLMTAILNGASADLSNSWLMDQVVRTGETICSDLYFSPTDQRNYIDFIAPVIDPSGSTIAVLCMKVDADLYFGPLLALWPIVDEPFENYLLLTSSSGRSMLYHPARVSDNARLSWKPLSDSDQIGALAERRLTGFHFCDDHHGQPSMAYILPVSELPWVLVVDIDQRALYAKLHSRTLIAGLLAFLIFILCFLSLLLVYKYRQANDLKVAIDQERDLRRYQERCRLAEQEVRARDLRFKQLVSELHEAVWTASPDGSKIFDVNEEFERICGRSAEALKGDPHIWDTLVHHEDRCLLSSSIRALKVYGKSDAEYRIVRQDASVIWVRDRRSLLFDDKGRAISLGGIITDISATKMHESQLIAAKEKAESNERLKAAFLSNMSHEIRTPLNCILGFTQLLGAGGLSEEEVQEYSGYIAHSGNRLLAMLSNIVELSRIESGVEPLSVSEFRAGELLEQIYQQFSLSAQKKGLGFHLDVQPDTASCTLRSDVVRLDRILSNLVGNAIKYTRTGSVTLGYSLIDTEIEFFVKDTGIGISESQRSHIFERFYQTETSVSGEYEGVGLGLALCKELASSLGGRLHFVSEPGKGTTFFLSVDCSVL